MKKLATGFVALLITAASFAQTAQTQQQDGKQQWHHRGHEKMGFKNLNFTDAQNQQMKQVNADFKQQMQTLNEKEDITVKEQRVQRVAIMKSHKNNITNILTPDQKNLLANMRKQGKQKHEEMTAKHLDKLKTNLSLSDDQMAQIKANQVATHDKVKAIMENKNLDRTAKGDQLKALHSEMKNNIGSVLTADQKAKFEAVKKDRHGNYMHKKERTMDTKDSQ